MYEDVTKEVESAAFAILRREDVPHILWPLILRKIAADYAYDFTVDMLIQRQQSSTFDAERFRDE